jgi:FlgD Ig-like domain
LGSYAILADLKIYEVSFADSSMGGGGAQGNRRDIRRYILYQNQPNPFKDLTKIAFAIPKECRVSLYVYNIMGRRVRTLIDEKMKPGDYNLKWDGKDNKNRKLSNGIYFYRLRTEDFKDTKKTILFKE